MYYYLKCHSPRLNSSGMKLKVSAPGLEKPTANA